MLLRRVLRVVNVVLLLGFLGVLLGAWWFFFRPLPQTSGEIHGGVAQPVEVAFDGLGVPHIRAGNADDLYFAQGFLTAQERMWQMDTLRRFSAGDLSEIVGPAALEADRASRLLRIRHIAELQYTTLAPDEKALLAAYARGVNAYLESHKGKLPFEFNALQYSPRPWSVVDTIIIALYMYRNLTTTWMHKLEKADMLQGGDRQKVEQLFPVRAGDEIQPGSNAWAVSGAHTPTGKPLLANDMHLEFSIPGIWYMASLEIPGTHVMGVTLPGVPSVIVGHNDRVSWGFTNLEFDVQDLYVEQLDERTGQYVYDGHREQAQLDREVIFVKRRKPEEMRIWVTRHGPVIRSENGHALALRWTAAEPGTFHFVFPRVNAARNWDEFQSAFSLFPGPGQNAVYADVDGNIGYHDTGMLPIRKGFVGDVPLDGTNKANEWQGYIPFEQLPHAFNPPSGYVVTANQNPFPPDYAYGVDGHFDAPYRSNQIRDMLRGIAKVSPADSLRVQKDVYSQFARDYIQAALAAFDRKKPNDELLRNLAPLLRSFDGQMDKDHAAPLIAVFGYQEVRRRLAESASPGKGRVYSTSMSNAVVRHMILQRPAGWFADWDDTLVDSLRSAAQEARKAQGRDPNKWRYGNYLQVTIAHPVAHQVPALAKYFDIGPLPMSGSATTVKQTGPRLGPSERMDLDLADWDHSLLNVPIGQSGHVLSGHYKDEWDAYYNGRSFPMQFRKVEVKSTLRILP